MNDAFDMSKAFAHGFKCYHKLRLPGRFFADKTLFVRLAEEKPTLSPAVECMPGCLQAATKAQRVRPRRGASR
jgi:hypothetical protein